MEDVTFTVHVYKLNTPQVNIVNRSVYGRGANYMKKIIENPGQNCYFPSLSVWFLKSDNYFTKKDYSEGFRDFSRTEKYRSGAMGFARIQAFC